MNMRDLPKDLESEQTASVSGQPGLSILVVEDNLTNQKLAIRRLEQMGHQTTAVENGRLALEAIQDVEFDLILMDIQMPEMDGIQATAAIREEEKESGKHIPIIAFTAHAMKGDRENLLAAGMDNYLAKPFRPEELKRVIDETMGEKSVASDTGEEDKNTPLLDGNAILEVVDGDHEFLNKLIDVFFEDCPALISEIRLALDKGNESQLQEAAHTLKGSAGVFGAKSLVDVAEKLENMGRTGDLASAGEAFSIVEEKFDQLLRELRKLRSSA